MSEKKTALFSPSQLDCVSCGEWPSLRRFSALVVTISTQPNASHRTRSLRRSQFWRNVYTLFGYEASSPVLVCFTVVCVVVASVRASLHPKSPERLAGFSCHRENRSA